MTTAISSCRSASTPSPTPPRRPPGRRGGSELSDVRCWRRGSVELPDGLVMVVGPNGAGKTSLVEAVVLGCLGVSPRTTREAEVVRRGAQALHVSLDLEGPPGRAVREIGFAARPAAGACASTASRRRSLAAWRARAVLVFLPDELRAVKGPPAARRRALDRVLEAASPAFADDLSGLQGALAQRNALLRRIRAGRGVGGHPPRVGGADRPAGRAGGRGAPRRRGRAGRAVRRLARGARRRPRGAAAAGAVAGRRWPRSPRRTWSEALAAAMLERRPARDPGRPDPVGAAPRRPLDRRRRGRPAPRGQPGRAAHGRPGDAARRPRPPAGAGRPADPAARRRPQRARPGSPPRCCSRPCGTGVRRS